MSDFSHIEATKSKLVDLKEEYTLEQIEINGVSPTLIVAPATSSNKPYINAVLGRSNSSTMRKARQGKLDVKMMDDNREQDRATFAKYVIKDWKDVVDSEGNEPAFGVKVCRDFLDALPDHVFDELRDFCSDMSNFVDSIDVEVKAKN